MSSGFDKIINNLLQILQEAGKNKTAPLDAQAEVRRVEGNTAWVHIAGGVDETPVRLTINARVGDKVQVRLSGGRAWITGNASAPPTDDHMANTANTTAKTANVTANQALQGANTAQNTADKAQSSADKAQGTANEAKTEMTEQKQFFYHDDEGAHVRDATNSKFRADLKSSGLYIVNLNTGKPSASFGATRCIIGGDSESKNLQITGDGVQINSGTYPMVTIRGLDVSGQTARESAAFNGQAAWEKIKKGGMFEITYELQHAPVSISSLNLFGTYYHIPLDLNAPSFGYTITKNKLHVYADGSYEDTAGYFWEDMDTLKITYTYSDLRGVIDTDVITGEEVYANNVFVRNPNETYVSIIDLIYPVGSIYMSVNSADPGSLIGGTWERIKDRFLLSAGDTYAAGNTGGSAKATLPSHTHTFGSNGYDLWVAKRGKGSTEPGNQISGDAKYYAAATGGSKANYKWLENVDSKGVSDVSQANMPPYLAVYVWKRIS